MRKIPLSRGLFALVDDDDYAALSKHKWFAKIGHRGHIYAIRHSCSSSGEAAGKMIRMQRDILGITDKGIVVDHRNGNTLDNQRGNLRPCRQRQNLMNQKLRSDSSTGFKGVSLSRSGKHRAYININKKQKSLGVFDCPIKAALAYDAAAKTFHGEFAKTNF